MGVGRYPERSGPAQDALDHQQPQRPARGVAGPGRLGTALAAALREAGVAVAGPAGRGEIPRAATLIVLCVPDAEIDAAAAAVGAAPLVGHTSGATPLSALAGAGARRSGCTRCRRSAADHPGLARVRRGRLCDRGDGAEARSPSPPISRVRSA